MSLNTAHANGGVLIFNGEIILLYCDGVELHFEEPDSKDFSGIKKGRIYLTSHRMIFTNKSPGDKLQSFSFPFFCMSGIELEQPIFGANFIKGKVSVQNGGTWTGNAVFKLKFLTGGAIEFGQAMLQAAKMASRYKPPQPPPYTPPQGPYFPAAPPAYTAPPGAYYGFVPPTHVFPNAPPANTVFMMDMPPPYPGISPPPYGHPMGGYPPAPGYPGNASASTAGYPGNAPLPTAGYPGNAPPPPAGFNTAYSAMSSAPGYTQSSMQKSAFTSQPSENTNFGNGEKSQAINGAYYYPAAPNYAYMPQANGLPPEFNAPPPPYSEASKKDQ